MKKKLFKIVPLVILAVTAGALAFSGLVMLLWNATLPAIFHIGTITLWQAAGLLLLSRILFSGFKGRRKHGCDHRGGGRWQTLSGDERHHFTSHTYQCAYVKAE